MYKEIFVGYLAKGLTFKGSFEIEVFCILKRRNSAKKQPHPLLEFSILIQNKKEKKKLLVKCKGLWHPFRKYFLHSLYVHSGLHRGFVLQIEKDPLAINQLGRNVVQPLIKGLFTQDGSWNLESGTF